MPLSVIRALFVCIFITACGPPRPLFGIRRLSAIRVLLSYYIYGDVSRCMYQRPLFGRCPLLGVSVNRDSTVLAVQTDAWSEPQVSAAFFRDLNAEPMHD